MVGCSFHIFLIFYNFIFCLVIIGIIVMGVFLGSLGHDDDFNDYTPAWAFYYFLISWFFTVSAFVACLTDRNK